MINLLKFKEHAEYEDGRDTQLTGYEAYQIYGKGVAQLLLNTAEKCSSWATSPSFHLAKLKS